MASLFQQMQARALGRPPANVYGREQEFPGLAEASQDKPKAKPKGKARGKKSAAGEADGS